MELSKVLLSCTNHSKKKALLNQERNRLIKGRVFKVHGLNFHVSSALTKKQNTRNWKGRSVFSLDLFCRIIFFQWFSGLYQKNFHFSPKSASRNNSLVSYGPLVLLHVKLKFFPQKRNCVRRYEHYYGLNTFWRPC